MGAAGAVVGGALAGVLVVVVIAGGVLWSNVARLPRRLARPAPPLAELQHIGDLVAGKAPTFINQYEIYADRHFLREGAPVEPAEYRSVDAAAARRRRADEERRGRPRLVPAVDARTVSLDRHAALAGGKPSAVHLPAVWQGRYYAAVAATGGARHARSSSTFPSANPDPLPYCGAAENGPVLPLCSVDPVAIPPCCADPGLGRQARADHAQLVAYQRPAPIVARADQTAWPGPVDSRNRGARPDADDPGAGWSRTSRVASSQNYELWLGGSFARGFEVSVDGRHVGRVKDELLGLQRVCLSRQSFLSPPAVHTIALTYPHADLTPGSGDNE